MTNLVVLVKITLAPDFNLLYPTVVRFSIKVQYGLQALLELALAYGGGPVQIKEIAKSQKLPIRYLEQLLLILKRGGLVVSQRGKEGGYLLKKHPSDIPLLELVEYLDGKIELVSKNMKKTPVLFSTFQVVQDKIKAGLAEVSLEDLVIRKRQRERSYVYNI